MLVEREALNCELLLHCWLSGDGCPTASRPFLLVERRRASVASSTPVETRRADSVGNQLATHRNNPVWNRDQPAVIVLGSVGLPGRRTCPPSNRRPRASGGMADALASGASVLRDVGVQVPLRPPRAVQLKSVHQVRLRICGLTTRFAAGDTRVAGLMLFSGLRRWLPGEAVRHASSRQGARHAVPSATTSRLQSPLRL